MKIIPTHIIQQCCNLSLEQVKAVICNFGGFVEGDITTCRHNITSVSCLGMCGGKFIYKCVGTNLPTYIETFKITVSIDKNFLRDVKEEYHAAYKLRIIEDCYIIN